MSALPKSKKLLVESETEQLAQSVAADFVPLEDAEESGPFKIKRIGVLNAFVAVIRFRIRTNVVINDNFKNEGIVVGVGPGVAQNGTRCPSQLQLGDVVCFRPNNIIIEIKGSKFYGDETSMIIIDETSLLTRMPPIKFEIVE